MPLYRPIAAALAAALVALATPPASARLLIEIDKSAQLMTVSQDGARLFTWPVSTGQRGYDTPGGAFTPFRLEKVHFSREWDDAPMPNSIFFTREGHAIHGTMHRSAIGRPASHGCVRLDLQNAQALFEIVKREGMANTRVVLFGEIPAGGAPAVAQRAPRYWPNNGGFQRYDDDDVTGSVPRGRPLYRGRYPDGTPVYTYRDERYRRLPPPQPYVPRARSYWDSR